MAQPGSVLVVDGANVVGSVPDGWWKDRPGAARRLHERLLVAEGMITDNQLARAVAERFGLDHIDLSVYRVDPDAAKLVTPAAVKRYQSVPVSFSGERTLLVAMVDPANVLAVDDIAVMTGYEVRPAVSSAADIEQLLERLEVGVEEGAVPPQDELDGVLAHPVEPSVLEIPPIRGRSDRARCSNIRYRPRPEGRGCLRRTSIAQRRPRAHGSSAGVGRRSSGAATTTSRPR